MKELNKRVGEVIRRIREQKGLTQEALAEAAGIHEKYVGKIERGLHGLTLEFLCKIATGLNLTVLDLLKSIFEAGKSSEEKETIIREIQSFLYAQSLDDLKFFHRLLLSPKGLTRKQISRGQKTKKA